MSRHAALALSVLLLLCGCAPWQTAVIGPSPQYPLAMWQGSDVRAIGEQQDGRRVTVGWARAIGVGLDPTWALVDFRRVDAAPPDASIVVVESLHRVDATERFPALGPLVERVLARHAIWVASHADETDHALEHFPNATRTTSHPAVTAIEWSTDRLVLTITTQVAAMAMARPCGGAPQPAEEMTLGGMEWSRTYDVTADGTITPINDDAGRALAGPPQCDPRLP